MPVDSDFFDSINDAQWVWYKLQTLLDEQEEFELLRDVAEHNAMFTNPEGVQKIREGRENKFETPSEDFNTLIHTAFGRDIPENTEDGRPLTIEDLRQQHKDKLDPYLDLELDEVKFTPYGED